VAKLIVNTTRDFSNLLLFDIDTLIFHRAVTATFAGSQFQANQLSEALHLEGSPGVNRIVVNAGLQGVDASGWTFSAWQSADRVVIIGTVWGDDLTGSSRNDEVFGNDGRDTVKAGGGDDLVSGGRGGDQLFGGVGTDTLSYAGSVAGVDIDLATNDARGGDAFGDTISGFENLIGSNLADELRGNSGSNHIAGGLGADLLIGRAGADRFVFNAVPDSAPGEADVILDFKRGDGDRIDLAAIDAITGRHDDRFHFIGEHDFRAAGDLRIERSGSETLVQGDVNGDGSADFEFSIGHHIKLISSDFIL
jgi:Ca2+-binding RTX toxin-like protein